MTGFFTDPYPEELFYSVCARYHARAKYRFKGATARDLFGNGRANITIDLPSRFDFLIESLPPGHTYSSEQLIYGNTLLPFFSPFVPPDRLNKIYDEMCRGDRGGSIHGRIGILTSSIRSEFLNFCTICVKEDRLKYKQEPYWHRLHQVPGVIVCPEHNVFLEQSQVHVLKRRSTEAFVTARQALTMLPPVRPIDSSNPAHQAHLRIARDAAWLMSYPVKGIELSVLRGRYHGLLLERKLASYAGVVRITVLQREFKEFYSDKFLADLQCRIDRRSNWLVRLVQGSRSTNHPIHHLLLIHFLNCSAEEFFRLPEKKEPFGKGPWPCLNKASDHYQEDRIETCEIGHTQDTSKRLTGTFRCDCGFIYRRIDQDESLESRYTISRVLSYGPIWETKLREYYSSRNLSLNERAARLGVSRSILINQAARLNLSKAVGTRTAHPSGRISAPLTRKKLLARDRSPEKYRKQWLRVSENNPGASRSKLRIKAATAYNWLIKYDKEWFNSNSPERLMPPGPKPITDWPKYDADMSVRVKETAERMMKTEGRPLRASTTAIARELGILSLVHKRAGLLPLTIEALEGSSETAVDYAIRRIEWARDCFQKEKIYAKYWNLVIRAALSYSMVAVPEVRTAIEAAVLSLSPLNTEGSIKKT
jgi:hypothetical protein